MKLDLLQEGQSSLYPPRQSSLWGIGLMLIGIFLYSTVNSLLKGCEQEYPIIQILFFRNFFALLFYLMLVKTWDVGRYFRTSRKPLLIIQSLAGVVSIGCLFQSVFLLPLADATALMFSSPLFMIVLSAPFLKEAIGLQRTMAMIIGFVGVLIIAKPSGQVLQTGVIFALAGAFMQAGVLLANRALTRSEQSLTVIFYGAAVPSIVCGIFLPFVWIMPTVKDTVLLVALGVGGGLGQYCIVAASRYAMAGTLGPMMYSGLIWSLLYGMLFFGENPTPTLMVGAFLIVGSGLHVFLLEHRRYKEQTV